MCDHRKNCDEYDERCADIDTRGIVPSCFRKKDQSPQAGREAVSAVEHGSVTVIAGKTWVDGKGYMWLPCENCHAKGIENHHKYCHGCGREIKRSDNE